MLLRSATVEYWTVTMRDVTSIRLLMMGLLLESVVSNAVAFQIIGKQNAASFTHHDITAVNKGRKSIHLSALVPNNNVQTGLADVKSSSSSLSSRRDILLTALSGVTAAAAASTIFTRPSPLNSASSDGTTTIIGMTTVDDAIAWINKNCDRRFLQAVVASDYHFLYRGVDNGSRILVMNEKSDLLLPETYGYSQDAVDFFRQLEIVMKDDAIHPSNGHLATTSAKDAAAWGTTAASMWPMMVQPDNIDENSAAATDDDAVHYAWFQNGGLFYPRPDARGFLMDHSQIIVDGRDCGIDSLDDVLTKDSCEVMVSAPRGFLIVPVSMDKRLKHRLRNSFLV